MKEGKLKNERLKKQSKLETDTEIDSLGLGEFSEKISETVGEDGKSSASQDPQDSSKSHKNALAGISRNISRLLRFSSDKEAKLPSTFIQRQKVAREIKKEQKALLKKANRIINSRKFSAFKYEQVVLEIRALQKIILELFTYAVKKVEQLYINLVQKKI